MPDRRRVGVTSALLLALLTVTVVGLIAAGPGPRDRVAELEGQLRCPVCKSVSIAESPSETAVAMRRSVAEQVAAGRNDAEILQYFEARYGEWVLLDPPAQGRGVWLLVLPAVVAVGGLALVLTRARRSPAVPELSDGDRDRVAAALADARTRRYQDEDDEP
ncbi:cytochrome c-type biogenesis protein [Blastococcus goldschmidtiae]|uniref:Cytochrome c-type biogenesis protein n=1 Tax=Blastococcus goldschmidtiae TaxID=3075546 RepID=A0ABU2K5W7_9ACTN|nr:cytochrome c-type biogenesis protein [Blastococcus sp. DSM 46792]MDT0275570.1 cytochrome c-type biogenesis protein [Blastococcus sp. DSM 46792]